MNWHKKQNESAFVRIAAYSSLDRARQDFRTLKRLRQINGGPRFDVAIAHRDESGEVHVRKRERETLHGAAQGVGIGTILGVLIPFAAIPMTVSINVSKGGLVSYYKHGMSRNDLAALGEELASGEAALIVFSTEDVSMLVEEAMRGADSQVQKRIADVASDVSLALAS